MDPLRQNQDLFFPPNSSDLEAQASGQEESFFGQNGWDVDLSRKPLCECSEDFLFWVGKAFPDLTEESEEPRRLDHAILAISKEFTFRARLPHFTEHSLHYCLKDCYMELLDALTARQDELIRLQGFSPQGASNKDEEEADVQEIYLGDKIE